MKFLVFCQEMHCETPATRIVIVKQLGYLSLQEQLIIYVFASKANEI